MRWRSRWLGGVVGATMAVSVSVTTGAAPAADPPAVRQESFDRDPGWEAVNNRVEPVHVPEVRQDFGYAATRHAAGGAAAAGEVGGRVTRSARPAYYGRKLAAAGAAPSLDGRRSASGTLSITASSGSSGVFFGWFNSDQPGGGGRPVNSLGLDIDGEGHGARLAVRLITRTNRAAGGHVTPFERGNKPAPIRVDGTRYAWRLDYDPEAGGGNGQVRFTIKAEAETHEAWEGKALVFDLPPEVREDGAAFTHFGLMNMMKPGGAMTIHFGDLVVDGTPVDLRADPGWDGSGNRARYAEPFPAGAQNFGYSATNHAGGAKGEIGGVFWRTEGPYGFYADRVGPLGLDDELEASGRIVMLSGGPDSDMCFGWFDGSVRDRPPAEAGGFLGVHVGGPTRVGHPFRPIVAAAKGRRASAEDAPVLVPGKAYEWRLRYDPDANGGLGEVRASLGDRQVTLPLKKGQKAEGARLDRFGLCTVQHGGQMVRVYLDDLRYTAARRPAR